MNTGGPFGGSKQSDREHSKIGRCLTKDHISTGCESFAPRLSTHTNARTRAHSHRSQDGCKWLRADESNLILQDVQGDEVSRHNLEDRQASFPGLHSPPSSQQSKNGCTCEIFREGDSCVDCICGKGMFADYEKGSDVLSSTQGDADECGGYSQNRSTLSTRDRPKKVLRLMSSAIATGCVPFARMSRLHRVEGKQCEGFQRTEETSSRGAEHDSAETSEARTFTISEALEPQDANPNSMPDQDSKGESIKCFPIFRSRSVSPRNTTAHAW